MAGRRAGARRRRACAEKWIELARLRVFVAALWVARRLKLAADLPSRLGTGLIALALMLAAEFGFVLRFRGLTLRAYFTGLDPIAGTVYWIALVVFALTPMMVARRPTATSIIG